MAEAVQAPELVEAEAPAPKADPVTQSGDKERYENDLARITKSLMAQPKVSVKLQEDTYVGINGYPFLIKGKERVSVPQQVADILEEAGRI